LTTKLTQLLSRERRRKICGLSTRARCFQHPLVKRRAGLVANLRLAPRYAPFGAIGVAYARFSFQRTFSSVPTLEPAVAGQQKTRRQAPGCSASPPEASGAEHSSLLDTHSSLYPTALRVESCHS